MSTGRRLLVSAWVALLVLRSAPAHPAVPSGRETSGDAPAAPCDDTPGDAPPDAPRVKESITVEAPKGYAVPSVSSATRTETPLRDVPQSVTVVTQQLIRDQLMTSMADVVRYVPGVTSHQGENNRDQVIMRGNSSSADFFLDGIRDDVQYYRDLYNLERVEALKGPNAMIFGRGGAGGVINRVTKEAGFTPLFEIGLEGGTYGTMRAATDVDRPLGDALALRLNAVVERSGSFRDAVTLDRWGLAPTLTYVAPDATRVTLSYERFQDRRVADRGITSFRGRPADVVVSTYYGNPDDSRVRADVGLLSASVEHQFGEVTVRNRTLFGDYDRFYQNYVPGATSPDGSRVTLTAYNNETQRTNLFSQTDASYSLATGKIRHTLLLGVELGRQASDNFRSTGYFGGTATATTVPFADPRTTTPVAWRQSATDTDNHVRANVTAFFAQDQVELSRVVQVLAGLRFDRFDLAIRNNRTGEDFGRVDDLVSPRAGLVVKPAATLSLYGSYSVTYLPGAGDQFASLTSSTQNLEPESFRNYEVGAKWEPRGALSLTAAVYRLDRTNTRSTDPNDPTRLVQTGSQRTNGFELGANGEVTSGWSVAGGYAYQDAFVTSATASAREGARGAQVPRHVLSLWNNVQLAKRVGIAAGALYRSEMYATVDNTVTLPGYVRLDAAAFLSLPSGVRVQVNVENLLGRKYYANADSNTNISPGSPRAVRLAATARF